MGKESIVLAPTREEPMSQTTLEERVARLEKRLDELVQGRPSANQPLRKDWRRTVGMFKGDPIMKAIIDEALRLREAERTEVRVQEQRDES
jgi:hypothetical protein